jgi:hypothetical protein
MLMKREGTRLGFVYRKKTIRNFDPRLLVHVSYMGQSLQYFDRFHFFFSKGPYSYLMIFLGSKVGSFVKAIIFF